MVDYKITNFKAGDTIRAITTNEKVKIIYSDETSETKSYNWVYTAKDYNDDVRLSDIKKK